MDKFTQIITSDNKPYGLHRSRDEKFFKSEKIMSLRKCVEPNFTFTDFDCYVSQSYFIIQTERIDLKYLTLFLNSKIVKFWLQHKGKMQGQIYQIDKEPLLGIPILSENEKEIGSLFDDLLLCKSDKGKIIEKIDTVFYNSFALTEEETNLIENHLSK